MNSHTDKGSGELQKGSRKNWSRPKSHGEENHSEKKKKNWQVAPSSGGVAEAEEKKKPSNYERGGEGKRLPICQIQRKEAKH